MRKIILLILSLCTVFSACQKFDDTDIWDSINSLDERVTALEKLCREMNTNINALQSLVKALENQDYITNVSPIHEGGKVIGYTISFANGDPITIYHGQDGKDGQDGTDGKDGVDGTDGKDGADGEDGKDGQTPVIGVMQDTDGIYYWTLNGQWLLDDNGQKIKAVGTDGQDGENGNDGAPGQDGAPGADGQDGKDGVTPKLKIEDGMWYVSYDEGATWTELGQATGDQGPQGETGATGPQGPQGPQGNPGVGGDSMFLDVDYSSNADYVIFVLGNGTQIKIPTWSAFEALKEQCEQMNANIEALQVIVNALQNNDYIKSITPIYEGVKEIGYIIEFTQSGKVAIYHGQDGKDGVDGTDGKDGQTPIIGVKQDTDGIYYWTLNGQWLLDDNGQKIKAVGTDGQGGENGNDGAPGADGQDGKDGVIPKLKIEYGMWYVSYDEGATWTELGQATGDQGPQGEAGPQGPAGTNGQKGDSFFHEVDYTSSSDYVIFTLVDGTQILVPTWSAYEALIEQCQQMNLEIEGLGQLYAALRDNDYVTSVDPMFEDGKEVGYIINFSQSGSVPIYHCKNSDAPVIGLAKDIDGVYYWTLDGQWLLDEDGNKVSVEGRDGQDGVTPKLKIEDGMWYVSYDNGVSWVEVGPATGPQGDSDQNADSFFQSVTQDEENVYLVLADGTEIIIPKIPPVAATVVLDNISGFTATFNGTVNRSSRDLKVTVYYGTTDNLTVYKYKGKESVTEFNGETFTLKLTGLAANTTYYYFTEVIYNGTVTFSDTMSFRTGNADSYVDWDEGENVGGDI